MSHSMRASFGRFAGLLLIALAVALSLGACTEPEPESVSLTDIERAQNALQPFKDQMVAALVESLEGGPMNTIHVCREKAPQIAAALSVDGVEMGRTSHRLRNPANAPQPWVEPLMRAYVDDPELSEPRAVLLDDSRFGYVEPIRTINLCINCHGPAVEEELLAEIRTLYPEDQATGFRVGDLRGLFWVTMPVGEL